MTESTKDPTVSVVVPSYNRPDQLRTCLSALAKATLPLEDFEVVVVDDGSREPLAPPDLGLRLRVHRQQNAGPAAARNAGAEHARAPLVAFTDDDCQPDPGWLDALRAAAAAHPRDALGGHTECALPSNRYSSTSELLVQYVQDRFNRNPNDARFFASNNFAVPRQLFLELGGFDISFPRAAGEDRELCERWRARGLNLRAVPAAVVRHAHPLVLASFCRQHFNYGRGAQRMRDRTRAGGGTRIGFEGLAFYGGIVAEPFRRYGPRRAAPIAALMAASQLAVAAGFLWQQSRGRNRKIL